MASNGWAAPFPGTTSSALIQHERGLFISAHDFQISAENTNWRQENPQSGKGYILTQYRAPKPMAGVQPALTVRVDELKSETSLKRFMQKNIQTYPRLGFTILSQKPVKVNTQEAYLVDITNPRSKRQLRQVVFLRDKTVVTLTCRAHMTAFEQAVKDCNQIVRNFTWSRN